VSRLDREECESFAKRSTEREGGGGQLRSCTIENLSVKLAVQRGPSLLPDDDGVFKGWGEDGKGVKKTKQKILGRGPGHPKRLAWVLQRQNEFNTDRRSRGGQIKG